MDNVPRCEYRLDIGSRDSWQRCKAVEHQTLDDVPIGTIPGSDGFDGRVALQDGDVNATHFGAS